MFVTHSILSLVVAGMVGGVNVPSDATRLKGKIRPAEPVPAPVVCEIKTTDIKENPVWKTSFVVSTTRTVYMAVDFASSRGHRQLTVFVNMPGNMPYQRFDVSFAVGVTPASGEQVAVQVSKGVYRVWVSMPVAGTMIERYNLRGVWDASAHLDGAASPNSSIAFTLL